MPRKDLAAEPPLLQLSPLAIGAAGLYEKPLVPERTMTLKAQAFKNGLDPSDVVSAGFVRQDRD